MDTIGPVNGRRSWQEVIVHKFAWNHLHVAFSWPQEWFMLLLGIYHQIHQTINKKTDPYSYWQWHTSSGWNGAGYDVLGESRERPACNSICSDSFTAVRYKDLVALGRPW